MSHNLATIDMITRDAVELFTSSNKFFVSYDEVFLPTISLQEATVLGVAAVISKNPVVSRRFWSG